MSDFSKLNCIFYHGHKIVYQRTDNKLISIGTDIPYLGDCNQIPVIERLPDLLEFKRSALVCKACSILSSELKQTRSGDEAETLLTVFCDYCTGLKANKKK